MFNLYEQIEELEFACGKIEQQLPMFALFGESDSESDEQYLRRTLYRIRCKIVEAKNLHYRILQYREEAKATKNEN